LPPTRRTATRLVAARCLRGWSCRIEIAPSDADRLDDARISTVILVGPAEKVELAITSSPHTMGAQRFRRARLGQAGARCGTACGAVRQRARPPGQKLGGARRCERHASPAGHQPDYRCGRGRGHRDAGREDAGDNRPPSPTRSPLCNRTSKPLDEPHRRSRCPSGRQTRRRRTDRASSPPMSAQNWSASA
jgi:hypothetical protein